MSKHWSPPEVAATVADYLAMLSHELRGEPYVKADHNRRLREVLDGRSKEAVEFKHANISAVMIELGLPYIDGYKPRGNYQSLLRSEVLAQLQANMAIEQITEELVERPAPAIDLALAGHDVFVSPPSREAPRAVYDRPSLSLPARRVNWLEREARNQSLGRAGELFTLQAEHRRLWNAGAKQLAERIEHVSATKGDGLGYDIASFEADGRERFIEVKTTAFGSMTPFFVTAKEVQASAELPAYHLYRVFKFREAPQIYTVSGSLRDTFTLDPVQFRATLT